MNELSSEKTQPINPEDISALLARIKHLEGRVAFFEGRYPNTSLLSPNFLARAFTVLGHLIVAQLIIAIPIWILVFGFMLLIGVLTR